MLEALQHAISLEASGNTLESLRLLARAVALSDAIAGTESSSPDSTRPIKDVTAALYGRLVRIGKSDRNAIAPLTLGTGDRLIYRVLFVDKGALIAAELVGNDTTFKAAWKQAQFPAAPSEVVAALAALVKEAMPTSGDEQSVAAPTMAFVVANAMSLWKRKAAGELLAQSVPLLRAGILPVATAEAASPAPILALPMIDAATSLEGASYLVDLSTGAIVGQWQEPLSAPLAKSVIATATEVLTDLGISSKAIAAAPYLPRSQPVTRQEGDEYDGVRREIAAAIVGDKGGTYAVQPGHALERVARLGVNWGQFTVHGRNEVVWLRESDIGPFIEYPKPEAKGGFLSHLLGKGQEEPHAALISASTNLRARPYDKARALYKLAADQPVSVLYQEAEAADAGATSDGARGKPKRWAFVKIGDDVGWVSRSSLKPVKLVKPDGEMERRAGDLRSGGVPRDTIIDDEPKERR